MASLRTAAEVAAEYTAARTAYLNALDKQSYSISEGGGSRSLSTQDVETLRAHMLALEKEYQSLTGGSGVRIQRAIPIED